MARSWTVRISLGLALMCVSCSAAPAPPPLYPVKCQVLYQGKPADGALVVFHPQAPPEPSLSPPRALVDAAGYFELATDYRARERTETYDGAPPGVYVVVVAWRSAPGGAIREPEDLPDLFNGRYSDPKTSGIRVEIVPGENILSPFRLK